MSVAWWGAALDQSRAHQPEATSAMLPIQRCR
jgi:hypothetical protein